VRRPCGGKPHLQDAEDALRSPGRLESNPRPIAAFGGKRQHFREDAAFFEMATGAGRGRIVGRWREAPDRGADQFRVVDRLGTLWNAP
jgi:hypothetical protein